MSSLKSWLESLVTPPEKKPHAPYSAILKWSDGKCETLRQMLSKYVTDVEHDLISYIGVSIWFRKEQLRECSIEDLGTLYSHVTKLPIHYSVRDRQEYPNYKELWVKCTDRSEQLGYIVGRTHVASIYTDLQKTPV